MVKHSKTRKAYRLHKDHDSMCDVTMRGIFHWYDAMFEKLGWMVLAKAHGYSDKLVSYKTSIQRLHDAIEHKITYTHEIDRKNDLQILLENVRVLKQHADADF